MALIGDQWDPGDSEDVYINDPLGFDDLDDEDYDDFEEYDDPYGFIDNDEFDESGELWD